MTTIRILPEILSNQIAAGEVVQRPSSIVKELVENSIDAGATSISVEIEKGGKSLIRVSDNGCGLLRDDALLSIERYATSKIFTKEDLFSISTMGFRGEALPSIASVSKFTLITRTKKSDIGTKIEIIGGKIRDVSDAGAPVGTMVEVKNLFFNTPARKKFLKSDNTETSHIADMISGMALGNSHIQFRLFLNKNLTKNFSLSDDLFQRSINVLGKDVSQNLYKIEYADDFMGIKGFAVHPKVCRTSSSKIFLFVNNRLIYDRGLISAIFQGYKGRLMKGRFPLAVLFIQIPFDQVDVNVHPSKREIKFFDHQRVYQTVALEIGKTLLNTRENFSESLKFKTIKTGSQDLYQGSTKEKVKDSSPKVEQSVFEWGIGSSLGYAQKEKGIEHKA
ncbi:MAG: DNA mismatch repair endonuclease MutL, partial [Proteobacteria bacterium]|nr:DNA mismatch repair endonuclease MutL [Pseudomonadota bacterium]